MKKIFLLYNYCVFRLKSGNEHSVHSPFVFDLLTKVIYDRVDYYSFEKIENLRRTLLKSKKTIVKNNMKLFEYGQLLFRLVNYFQPTQIIELGTSVGINSAYMASVSSKNHVIAIESNSEIAEISKNNFEKLELKNIEQIVGDIDSVLPTILAKCEFLEFVCFTGNASKNDTLNRFNKCLEKINGTSIFIFDNMYCSSEMKEAWNEIKNHDRVRVTVDLFFMGIIFFREEQVKQHFVIRYR